VLTIGQKISAKSLELVRQKDRRPAPTVGMRSLVVGLDSDCQTGLQSSIVKFNL